MNSREMIRKNVSRETFSLLDHYTQQLTKWNRAINLIGPVKSEEEIWERHIGDALQLLEIIPSKGSIADMGSGGGLPGLILAIARPEQPMTLIEKDQRKSAFLVETIRNLALPHVKIEARGVEEITEKFAIITARALAPLHKLCAMAYPLMGKNAICCFPKGENFAREIEEARQEWDFEYGLQISKTNEKSFIITLTELSPKESRGKA